MNKIIKASDCTAYVHKLRLEAGLKYPPRDGYQPIIAEAADYIEAMRDGFLEILAAAQSVIDWHDALDGDMGGVHGQDAITKLQGAIKPMLAEKPVVTEGTLNT
jgi:hypothetical protein